MYNDTVAYLDAQLPCLNANYTIALYDPTTTPPSLITTITNSTTTGIIEEDWNLTYQDNTTPFSGDLVDAVFHVTLSDPGEGTSTKHLVKVENGMTEVGPNVDFGYFYTPQNGTPTLADFGQDGAIWYSMLMALDYLIMPAFGYPVYDSYFNQYYCFDCTGSLPNPGYLSSMSIVMNELFPDMADGLTKQFYCHGHGAAVCMNAANYNDNGVPHFLQEDIVNLLNNHMGSDVKTISTPNPYRFVFLDGCSTASRPHWEYAFGIYPLDKMNVAARNQVGPQAFVGYFRPMAGWPATSVQLGEAYGVTLGMFFNDWMNGCTLAECIYQASQNSWGMAPFPVTGYGYENRIELKGQDYNGVFYDIVYSRANHNAIHTSPIYVIGHTGLTVTSYNPDLDGLPQYTRPSNIK